MLKLADHTIVSIIIAIQFLGSLLWIVTILMYARAADPRWVPLMLLFCCAGVATAVALQKKAIARFSLTPGFLEWRRRVPALLWNGVLAAYLIWNGALHAYGGRGEYTTLYVSVVAVYLAVTAAIGYGRERHAAGTLAR